MQRWAQSVLLSLVFIAACKSRGPKAPAGDLYPNTSSPSSSPGDPEAKPASPVATPEPQEPLQTSSDGQLVLEALSLAQTHVLSPSSPLFRLVGDRPALLKVNLSSPSANTAAPKVVVSAHLGERQESFMLTGPSTLGKDYTAAKQSLSDSFTVLLPSVWIQPGLKLELTAGDLRQTVSPKVGAPNPLTVTTLSFFVFKQPPPPADPAGWQEEAAMKLPVSRLEWVRKDPWLLTEVVVPPRADVTLPAVRVSNAAQYQEKTGKPFDGEQGLILGLTNAIQVAAGEDRLSVYYAFAFGVPVGGGLADTFTAMGLAGHHGVLLHELGHTLSLPHWAENPRYPYQGDINGSSGDPGNVGLTWGFDSRSGKAGDWSLPYLIPPTVQEQTVGRTPGVIKKDPMAGGGTGDQEKGFVYRMFSDFSVRKMQTYLEGELILWNKETKEYSKWDDSQSSYRPLASDGVSLPLQREVMVITLPYTTSAVTAEANFIYKPLGPHRSSLIRRFDPTIAPERAAAAGPYCQKSGCDFSLRVRQAGVSKSYILRGRWNPDAKAEDAKSLFVGAINLPAAAGPIEAAELLLTPNVAEAGLGAAPRVLYSYASP